MNAMRSRVNLGNVSRTAPRSRVVLLTELHVLFERRLLLAPANRITPRPTSGAAPAMNRLPRDSAALASVPSARFAAGPVDRPLGSAAAAPVWAWAGSQGGAYPPAIVPAPLAVHTPPAQALRACPIAQPVATAGAGVDIHRGDDAGLGNSTNTTPHEKPREVRIPSAVLRAMAAAAAQTGRHESELWAEAAREWLDRLAPGDDPPPATAALAPTSALRASRDRGWGAIDILLSDLRAPDRLLVPAVAGHPGSWDGSAA